MQKVFFRADGNSEIGLGHLIRSIALAQMLKGKFDVTFICKELPETIEKEIVDNRFEFEKIHIEDETLDLINNQSIVVLDGYEFGTEYQTIIKETGSKLVCIDDLHDKEFKADLIINHAPGIKAGNYKAKLSTQFSLGTDYALLRPEFIQQANKSREIEKIETVFICFGGSDANNFTEAALKAVSDFDFKKIIVVTGSGYLHQDSLKKAVEKDSRIEQYNSIDAKEMSELMLSSDLAIVPSSGILLEALASGCRIISGMTADNQKYVYNNYLQSGYFIDGKDFGAEDLKSAINSVLNGDATEQKKLDGKSKDRLLKLFLQLALRSKVTLKKASGTDLDKTYEWASDPAVRAYSFSQNKISKEEHTNWFTKKIADENCLYLIAETDGNKIGSIRFDIKDNEAVISYLIAPDYHGKGLGQIILTNGLAYIEKEIHDNNLSIKKIIGYVMEANIPSVKAFERLGFNKIIEADRIKYEKEIL